MINVYLSACYNNVLHAAVVPTWSGIDPINRAMLQPFDIALGSGK